MNNDLQNPAPKKSSTLKWLLVGCGCLTLLGLIAAAIIVWKGAGLFGDMKKLVAAMEGAMKAPEVIEAFGTPVEVVGKQSQTQSKVDGATVIVISQEIKGPKGTGKMEIIMEQKGASMPRVRSGKIFTPEGKEIILKLDGADATSIEPGTTPAPTPAPALNPPPVETPAPAGEQ